jgi:hypothetical protein
MIVIKEPADFTKALTDLGLGPGALSTIMTRFGDDRPRQNIRRNLQRMATGEARVSGEMRAILNILVLLKEKRPDIIERHTRRRRRLGRQRRHAGSEERQVP